jgi:ribosomal protein S18 acetylase RimI-like enzyme
MNSQPTLSRIDLCAAVEQSRFDWHALAPDFPGWETHDDPDLLWHVSNQPQWVFNNAIRARFTPETVEARLDEIIGTYKQRGLPVLWWVTPSSEPSDLGERLLARGLVGPEPVPTMAADLTRISLDVPPVPGLDIVPLREGDSLYDYADVIRRTNDWDQSVTDTYHGLMAAIPADGPIIRLMGTLNGEPVATGAVTLHPGSIVGVYNICTVPEARRMGIGAAMTLAGLRDAYARGARWAVLQASEMGAGIYRAMGFEEVCSFDAYLLER